MAKVKLKKRNISIAIGCVVVLVVLIIGLFRWKQTLDYQKTFEYRLENHGYSEEDTAYLIEKLDEKELEKLLEKEADENIPKFMKESYYLKKNLEKYLAYYQENPEKSLSDVVAIINVRANEDWYTDPVEADTSKENLLLVNKFHQLSKDFEAPDLEKVKNWYAYGDDPMLRKEAYEKFIDLFNAAKEDGLTIIISSAYRDYEYQDKLYNDYLIQLGQKKTDEVAARPGFSEHQTGLTVDVTTYGANTETFETFEEFTWLQNHAHEYGFILRYPKDKEYLTGYGYESWHYRYVGVEAATYIYEHNITFDEYYAYFVEGDA